jgi:hypothetical protein
MASRGEEKPHGTLAAPPKGEPGGRERERESKREREREREREKPCEGIYTHQRARPHGSPKEF